MMMLMILGLLLALNALFVAAEFAIIAAPTTALQQLSQQNHRLARQVLQIKNDPVLQDEYIAAAQLGITLASLGLGMYGEHQLAEWILHKAGEVSWLQWLAAHSTAAAVAVGVLTYFHVVLGEMIPKTLALQKSKAVVLAILPLMKTFMWVMSPLIKGLNLLGNAVLHLLGVQRTHVASVASIQDLQFIVDQSEAAGALEKEAANFLQELLAFTEMDALELMVPRVHMAALEVGCSPEKVRQVMMQAPHSRYPVYQESLDQILGFVHLKDLYFRLQNPDATDPVRLSDVRPVPFLPATAALEKVLSVMHTEQVKMVILLDEFGGTAGLITLEDLMAELVGPIDARELYEREIRKQADGSLLVEGTVQLETLGEELELELEHAEVDTVSGLVLDILERLPQVGDVVVFQKLSFEVLALQGKGVERCRVSRLEPPVQEEED